MSYSETPKSTSYRHEPISSLSSKKLIKTEPRYDTEQSINSQRPQVLGLGPKVTARERKRSRELMREKLSDLRRKKDAVKQAVKRKIERGARRILSDQKVNRFVSYARRNRKDREDEDELEEQVDTSFSEEEQPSQQKIMPLSRSKTFSFSDEMLASEKDDLPPLLLTQGMPQVPEGKRDYYKLTRKNSGLSYFTPTFILQDAKDGSKVLFGKKVSPFTFLIQIGEDWGENSPTYMGKLVSNLTGSQISCYLSVGEGHQQLVGSICYTNSYLQFSKPRTIEAYFYNFYRFYQFKPLSDINSIKQIMQNQGYAGRVITLKSRQPTYNPKTKTYLMNFAGRAGVSSVKNCILENTEHPGRDAMLLAKQAKNRYSLDFMTPLSPFMAFAIALTNFNGKIINQ